MYLSKIEIIGFKSFAQHVNLKFDTGITAIVGPNGCGKTNIVDAIRWALGEQRYSTLRSDKMEDVIFNGTKNRKPLGLSEVSLLIENTRGILPTEYSEVTITRRAFRSGDSEYLLNRVPCRLKDILDLFMDTGMGSDAYSVIELKMVESILSDKADERRRLFEEAAGVTKYKFRRKAAYRKLEAVQQDLLRVNDIVKEVQKTVSSLERQAKKAEQYNEVSLKLRSLEIDLQEREYAYLVSKLKPLEEKFAFAQTDKAEIDEVLQQQDDRIDHLRLKLHETEMQMNDVLSTVTAQSEKIHRVEEKILVAHERLRSLSNNIERYEKEKIDLHAQRAVEENELASLSSRNNQLHQHLSSIENEYTAEKTDMQSLHDLVDSKKIEVLQVNEELFLISQELVQKRVDQERTKAQVDNYKGRIDRSSEDNKLYENDVKNHEDRISQLTNEDRELRRRFVEAEMLLFEREKSKQLLKEEIEQIQAKRHEIKNEIDRRTSKFDFLKRMIESNEGLPEGTKYLLNQEQWKKKKLATIADVVQTSEKYRVAVQAALAETANYLIVDRAEDAYAAIEDLNKSDQGKVTFVCLKWVPSIRSQWKRQRNVPFIRAIDVIQVKEPYRALVNFILDDVVIVETLSVAKQVFEKVSGIRCVTFDGQVAHSLGVLRGGSQRFDEGGLISKKSQLSELEQEITLLQQEANNLSSQQTESTQHHDTFDLKPYIESVKSIEREMTAIEMRIAQLEFEKKRANDGIERNTREMSTLQRDIDELQLEYERLCSELIEMDKRKREVEFHSNKAHLELETLELQMNEKTRSVNDIEKKVITIQGDIRNVEHEIERTQGKITDIDATLKRRDQELMFAREEIDRLTIETKQQQDELGVLQIEFQDLENKKRDIEKAHTEKRNELHQIELSIKDERRLHDKSMSVVHDLEMKITELRSNIDHLILRAKEEFEIDLQLKTYPDDEWIDFARLRDDVKTLKDRIRVLGAINFAAFDEYKTEGERLIFLTQQRDDLLEAEKTLLSTIEEINATAQRKFLETFSKIRNNFIVIFKELFLEGDECDLRLEEDVDPLEGKIEIIAKPRGKRPTSIDLLSGGEKTLTAIALLFAIYLVKPSPFCILDEVDAPLDDSNIDRFTRILRKFSDKTQFIVVTHNKRTMEAASALYGVTMEEEGVSKIVTVRFNEEARVRSATVTN
ncbi:MAG TPA: chromosome segregation protein SMC [Bacteroidota bacterium]|nr:chromosome segregation protein SMC [Bacteroidota bacterium]